MPAYNTPLALYKQASPGHGFGGTMKVAFTEIAITAALLLNDTFDFFELPAGSRIVGGVIEASDLDTAGSPTVTIHVGDAGDPDRLFASSNVGQAGTAGSMTLANGLFHKYTERTKITGLVAAAPTTGVAGTIRLAIFYVLD